MRCLDLFAGGCNGFGLAAKWMGWQTVACVEIDPFCQKLLKKNFPEAEIYGDIREFNRDQAAHYRGSIDLVTGGFPCQPFSHAGKREGTNDDRYLWPAMLETISIVRPAFVIGENVAGLTSMDDGRTFDNILASLEDEGYSVESFILPAASVGAWHRRDRLWIVAYSPSEGLPNRRGPQMGESRPEQESERFCGTTAHSTCNRIQGQRPGRKQITPTSEGSVLSGCYPERSGQSYWQAEPGVDRMVSRLPNRVDRIKSLGNAVVPQVVYEIYKAIEKTFLT